MLEAHPPLAGWAVGETAFASAQEVLSPYSSIHPPPNLRINIATLNLSLLSLNQGTKVKSTKLAKSLKEESLNCQATVANVPLVDWRPAKHQLQDKVVLAVRQGLQHSSPSSATCSRVKPRRIFCESTSRGLVSDACLEENRRTAPRRLRTVQKKQIKKTATQNINDSPLNLGINLTQLGLLNCSTLPGWGSDKAAVICTTTFELLFAPWIVLSQALSPLLQTSLQRRLSQPDFSDTSKHLSKISTLSTRSLNLQAILAFPDTFFGFRDEDSDNSRAGSPEPTNFRGGSTSNPRSSGLSTVPSAPPEGEEQLDRPKGGDDGSPPGGHQGDRVLIGFLCPDRPDIALTVESLSQPPEPVMPLTPIDPAIDPTKMDIDEELSMDPKDKEKGETNGQEKGNKDNSNDREGTQSNGTSDNSQNGSRDTGTSGSPIGGSQSGSSGGSDGDGGDKKKSPSANGTIDSIVEERKEEDEQKKKKSEKQQDEQAKNLIELANQAESIQFPDSLLPSPASGLIALHNSRTKTAHRIHPDSTNPPQPTALQNGSNHSPNGHNNTLPVIADANHRPSSPKMLPSIHQLAELALKQPPFSTSQPPDSFSPGSQRSVSNTPQTVPVSPPGAHQAQAGYGQDGAHLRKPLHHMTVQERQAYVHPAPTQPPPQNVYYSYPYQPLSEDIHANGPQTSLPPPPYTPGPPSTYPPSRDLPTLYNQPSQASYHYSPHEQGQPETVPIRTGSAANLFAQQTYDENNPPSGPSTGDTITSTGSDETIVPPVTSPRRNHVSRVNSDGSPGTFKCQFAGCTAAPFQTQYLLNSHANVHSQTRPHFCPVPGCPRGEKGRGFKRKNEMIRHGLVHDSPGYVCPFCPDREHKYPRPDNLQRHVRVHHTDKSRDDPRLREVLAKRPEGGTRGRRRRAAPP